MPIRINRMLQALILGGALSGLSACGGCHVAVVDLHEKILGADPGTYEFEADEADEIDIFEQILDAFDKQTLEDEKNTSTIN